MAHLIEALKPQVPFEPKVHFEQKTMPVEYRGKPKIFGKRTPAYHRVFEPKVKAEPVIPVVTAPTVVPTVAAASNVATVPVVKPNEQDLQDLINKAVEKNLAKIASMTQSFIQQNQPKPQATTETQSQRQEQSLPVHCRVRCDGCKVSPIAGIRYKCSVLPNFDFCEQCEQTKEHPYAFIKIKYPGQTFSHASKMSQPCFFMPLPTIPTMPTVPAMSGLPFASPVFSSQQINQVQPPAEQVTSSYISVVPEKDLLPKKEVQEKPPQTEEKIEIVEEKREVRPESQVKVTIEDETEKLFKDGQRRVSQPIYPRQVITKAAKLKQRLPDASYDRLLAFVNQAPEDLSLAELAENFKY